MLTPLYLIPRTSYRPKFRITAYRKRPFWLCSDQRFGRPGNRAIRLMQPGPETGRLPSRHRHDARLVAPLWKPIHRLYIFPYYWRPMAVLTRVAATYASPAILGAESRLTTIDACPTRRW